MLGQAHTTGQTVVKNLEFLAHFHLIKKPPFNHQKSIFFGLYSSFPLDDFFDGTFLGYLGAILGTYGLF